MGKSRNQNQRDVQIPSLGNLLGLPTLRPLVVIHPLATSLSDLRELEDRRVFTPGRSTTPPKSTRPGASRVVADARSATRIAFHDPSKVAICARRERRREVLFALKKTRKGSGSSKRRNFWSDVKC